MMAKDGIPAAIVELWREAFEGMPKGRRYTWFVEGKEGLFDAMDRLSAAEASMPATGEAASLAAHFNHLLYILRSGNMVLGRPGPEGNWNSTWERQIVDEAEWEALRNDIRREYADHLAWLEGLGAAEIPAVESVVGVVAILPHVAYHLGAIRHVIASRKPS